MRYVIPGLVLASACLVLQACATVPPATALALRKVDPLTTDVSQIRVAYVGPEVLRVDARKAKLELTAANAAHSETLKQAFALVEVSPADAPDSGTIAVPPGMVLRFFKLPPEEAARLEKTRALIAEERKASGGGKGTLSVGADGCLEHETTAPLPISAYLRTAETGRFVPLFEDMNLRDIVKANKLTLDLCGK